MYLHMLYVRILNLEDTNRWDFSQEKGTGTARENFNRPGKTPTGRFARTGNTKPARENLNWPGKTYTDQGKP